MTPSAVLLLHHHPRPCPLLLLDVVLLRVRIVEHRLTGAVILGTGSSPGPAIAVGTATVAAIPRQAAHHLLLLLILLLLLLLLQLLLLLLL